MEATWTFPREKDLYDYLFTVLKVSPEEDRQRRHLLITQVFPLARDSLRLPSHVCHHAALLLHRLLLVLPNWPDPHLIAVSVLIAGKTEETSRKATDIVAALPGKMSRELLLELEATAMARTGFDFAIDTVNRHVHRLSCTVLERNNEEVGDLALQLAEQAMASPAPLLYSVKVIAAACVIKAAGLVEVETKKDAEWRCEQQQLTLCMEYLKSFRNA